MIKTLFLIGALLVPGLAYAANPSAPFTVQVVDPPSGIACDIGPPYTGAIPAAATQAGFTHCAANYDFTYTGSFTDSLGTHQWTNLSSWLDCSKNTNSGVILYLDTGSCDTSHENIISDGGVQVLALSYYLGNSADTTLTTAWCCTNGTTGTIGTTLPAAFYLEQVYRLSSYNVCSQPCILWATSTWAADAATGTNPCFFAGDLDENGSTGGTINTSMAEWNPVCGTSGYDFYPSVNNPPPGPSTSSYSTYGFLWTTDGTANYMVNDYHATGAVRGLPGSSFYGTTGAASVAHPSSAGFSHRITQTLNEGPQSDSSYFTGASHTTYIQRITIWACSGWATGTCPVNPVITTAP